jgi:hypothetical protein
MTIRKIEAGRVITKTIDTFIGQEGTIFYDKFTGELRLSDGVTPGGKPLSGIGNIAVALQGTTLTNKASLLDFVGEGLIVTSSGTVVTIRVSATSTGTTSTFLIKNLTSATSTNSGALQVEGGVGIGGDLVVGGRIFSCGMTVVNSIGYTGSSGQKGDAGGYTGSKGDIGYSGSVGYDGSRGYTGYDGSIGYSGSVGYDGSRGYTGYDGSVVYDG